nr:phosphoribosyl-AMP cyclohydrolase [uncultured Devosia sp.]
MTQLFADPATLTHEQRDEGSTFAPRFDASGTVMAITVEAGTNELLMVGVMNAEALRQTMETGYVHYWSRSRSKLWKKGETSGELQRVVEIRVDCDQDAIQILVEQSGHGAACHTGRKTCFYRRVVVADGKAVLEDRGLPRLFDPKEVYR